jgi:hypothetical protein
MSLKAFKKSKTRRLRNSSDLGDTPQWALNADQAFLERKLEIVRKRKREGKPAHGKYENYESNLNAKLSLVDQEIAKRKRTRAKKEL